MTNTPSPDEDMGPRSPPSSDSVSSTSLHPFEPHTPPAAAPEQLRVGQRLGRYIIGQRLGMGGFGVVYAAHDESLDRAVALKVLWPGRHRGDRVAQLRREARAMAQLRHPNIVTVFDVGLADEQPFIVMERVDGGSMREWLTRTRPSIAAIVTAILGAARGLAAAHRAGLVHRDIKLSNLLVGSDDRVRVSDFGLVTAPALQATTDTPASTPEAGTAAYMAPERSGGEPPDQRSDQYALCVALYTALHGHYPFERETPRMGTTQANELSPTLRRELPPHVRAVILRGLATDPTERFDSVDALIAALDRRPRGRQLAITLGAVTVIASSLALASASGPAPIDDCRRTAAVSLWPHERRDAVTRALHATEAPFARSSSTTIDRQLSTYAGRWSQEYAAVCDAEATTPQDRQALEATLSCLRRSQLRVDALTRALSEADRPTVEHAAPAVEALPLTEDCGSGSIPPWATGDDADRIEEQLAQAEVLRQLGRYADAEALADNATSSAEATNATAASARTQLQRGLARLQLARADQALVDLEAAYFVAHAEHDESTALHAAIELLQARVIQRPDPDAAQRWERAAEALTGPMTLTPEARAKLLYAKAERAARAGDHPRQLELHREALELRRGRTGEGTLALAESLEGMGRTHMALRNAKDAGAMFREALEIRRRRLGRGHPVLAIAHNNYGIALAHTGQQDEARTQLDQGLLILEESLGPQHPRVGRALNNLGSFTLRQGAQELAQQYLARAVTILSTAQGPTHPETLQARASWAETLRQGGEHQHAVDEASRVMTDAESVELTRTERAILHSVLGTALIDVEQLERSLEVFEAGAALLGPDEDLTMWLSFQRQIAAVLRLLGRTEEAYRVARRAWARFEPGRPPYGLALVLSQLEFTRRNYSEALAMAKLARNGTSSRSDPEGTRQAEFTEWIEEIEEHLPAPTRSPG